MKIIRKALLIGIPCVFLLLGCGEAAKSVVEYVDWDPEYTKTWAPEIGTALPSLIVKDGSGEARDFASLSGEQGLLIFFVRSTNW